MCVKGVLGDFKYWKMFFQLYCSVDGGQTELKLTLQAGYFSNVLTATHTNIT